MYINKITYQILTIFSSPKIHTNLLWDLTFLFLILGGLYFVSIFFFRNRLSRLSFKTKGKRQELAPIISNFLFHSPEDPKQEQKEYVELKIEIREYLSSKHFRKIISQILFDLQKDVAGGTRERLFKLYKELELHHDAFQKLESWRWETVAQGILELAQMEVDESYQLIRKFINDRRGVVRKQAELATVSLRADGIDYLLDTTRHSISEWQQLKLIETLGKRKNYRPPQFKGWLLSQNKDVVLFALRLIKHYNQKGAEASIGQLVKHKNDEVRIAAVQCIVDFNFKSTLPILKSVFPKSSNTVKISILNAVACLGSEADIPFLEHIAKTESSFVIVGKAQSTINAITPETILPSKDIVHFNEVDNNGATDDDKGSVAQEVDPEEKANYIEVDDIELYDEVDFNQKPKEENNLEQEPAFELKPIEEEYGQAMDGFLGALTTDNQDSGTNDFHDSYDASSHFERTKIVGMLGESADERELPLLEHITEHESDSELRFHAFKKMQSLKERRLPKVEEDITDTNDINEQSLITQSVFYSLYHHTDDEDAKRILLKEIKSLGDLRDLPFLKSLLHEEDKRTLRLVKKVIAQIESVPNDQKEKEKSLIDDIPKSPSGNEELSEPIETTELVVEEESDERIPMELFMLYEELGIGTSEKEKSKEQPFDFELSTEYFFQLHNPSKLKKSNE